jgi:hypothetical protein
VILYERETIDLDVDGRGISAAIPGRAWKGERAWAGTTQSSTERQYDEFTVEKVFVDAALYRKLRTFWSYAMNGGIFTLALNSAKAHWQAISLDPLYGNVFDNGDLDVWESGVPRYGTLWVKSGSGTLTRETKLENVRKGLFAARLDGSATCEIVLKMPSQKLVPVYSELVASYYVMNATTTVEKWTVYDPVGDLYWKHDTSEWVNPLVWNSAPASTTAEYELRTFAVGNEYEGILNDCYPELWVCAYHRPTTDIGLWFDDLRLALKGGYVFLRNLGTMAIGDQVKLFSRTRGDEELAAIDDVLGPYGDGTAYVSVTPVPSRRYDPRDLLIHDDTYLFMAANQDESALTELEGGVYRFKLKCRQAETGRS